ncbi:MAG: DNA double-strand break repair nuclease NurA [Nanopusillaceae archaeon]
MINKELLNILIKKIENIRRENIEVSKFKEKIKTINIDNVAIREKREFAFIDSSYINGIIGPYAYIYAKAVITGEKVYEEIRDIEVIPSIFISSKEANHDLSQISSLVAKNLEYILAKKYSNKYIFIDGSIISDGVLLSQFSYELDEENIERIRKNFAENFVYMIEKGKLLAIAKRILNLKIFDHENKRISDFQILLNIFPKEVFYTEIIEKNLGEIIKIKKEEGKIIFYNKNIYFIYFRTRPEDHIYRIEAIDNISKEEFLEIVKENIYLNASYPRYLKLSHNLCKITNKEKTAIERFMKKYLGYSYTSGWETH